MKHIQNYIDERLLGAEFNLQNPLHRKLFASFKLWYEGVKKQMTVDSDLVISMLHSAEEDIRYGEM